MSYEALDFLLFSILSRINFPLPISISSSLPLMLLLPLSAFFLSFFLPVLLYILLFSFFLSLFLSFYLSFFVPIYLSLSLTIFLSSFPCILLTSSHNCSLLRLPTGLTLTYQKWKGDNTYFSLYSNLQTHKLVCIYYSTSSLPHPLS